jgi:hypothetical protein
MIILAYNDLFSQYYRARHDDWRHKNIRVEILGNHLIGGLNYDMRFLPGRMDGPGASIGTGFFYLSDNLIADGNNKIYIQDFPIEFNYLFGKKSHSLVLGAGVVPMYINLSYQVGVDVKILFWEINELKDNPKYFGVPAYSGRIGYRYQPKENGFTCEVALVPIVIKGVFIPSMGFSIGYGFK